MWQSSISIYGAGEGASVYIMNANFHFFYRFDNERIFNHLVDMTDYLL